jgi:DNA-binding LacI/PurR family transcriptional regulator
MRALNEHGLPTLPALVAEGLTNESEARAAMERFLSLPEPPTAFVAASDLLVIYAMSVAAQRSLRAGRDYAITGFDDLPMAAHTDPPLTTLRQPFGRVCDELIALLARIISKQCGVYHVLLRPELIVRGSG